jgi:diguanylate cyclase
MTQTPLVICAVTLQRLKELGLPPTPENYADWYVKIQTLAPKRAEDESPKPNPRPDAATAEPDAAPVEAPPSREELKRLADQLRGLVEDVSSKTETLVHNLGERNTELRQTVQTLTTSREKSEILRLLSAVVSQSGMIQSTVTSSHKELVEAKQSMQRMEEELAETRSLLHEDALTGARNRRGMDESLAREAARAKRAQTKLTVSMVDLDYFKKVNDTYGHDAGDKLLVHLSTLIKTMLREADTLVRYGGEEFLMILPETDVRGGQLVMGRLQQMLAKMPLVYEGKEIPVTFSAGLAQLRDDENGHALVLRADAALYAAKHAGRNRVMLAA